jgi:hypothetical protein
VSWKPPSAEEVARHSVLFELLQAKAGTGHWKSPFEVKFRIASMEVDPPMPKGAVRKLALELVGAVQWFHGAAAVFDLETMAVRPHHGEAVAYWFFDGYELTIGSMGYQG